MSKRRKKRAGAIAAALLMSSPVLAVKAEQAPSTSPPASGVVVIDSSSLSTSTDLQVAQGSTAILDFSNGSTASLLGNLSNAGTIYAISSNPSIQTVSLSANNIVNQSGGLITTILPTGGLAGFGNLVSNLNLNLTAVNNIVNSGTISSAGSLSLVAGGTVSNVVTNTQGVASAALMQAMNNVNIQAMQILNQGSILSQTGNVNASVANVNSAIASITNSGTIQSILGSINIASPTHVLNFDGRGGTMSAASSILMETLSSLPTADDTPGAQLGVVGGTFNAPNVSFNTPHGDLQVRATQFNGEVSVSGCIGVIGADAGDLNIGSLTFTGDPIIYSSGDVDLSGYLTGSLTYPLGADFIVLAGGNILAPFAPGGGTIFTANGEIKMYAGANFNVFGVGNPVPCFNCSTDYAVFGGNSSGGSVLLPNADLLTVGAPVTLQAYQGSSPVSGYVQIGNIATAGNGGAGARHACTSCGMTNASAAGNGGSITISGMDIQTGYLRSYGGGGGGAMYWNSFESSDSTKGGNAGNISVIGTGYITIAGDVNASGGGGGGGTGQVNGAPTGGGNAGNITIRAGTVGGTGAGITISGPVTASGGGGGSSSGAGGGSFGGGGGGGGTFFSALDSDYRVGDGGGSFGPGAGHTFSTLSSAGGGGGYYGGGANAFTTGILGAGGHRVSGTDVYDSPWGVRGFIASGTVPAGVGDVGQSGYGGGLPSGSPGNGGLIQLQAQGTSAHINITGTAASYYGFSGTYSNVSVAALGPGGHIDATVSTGSAGFINTTVYQSNANYGSSASTFPVTITSASPNDVVSAGTLRVTNGIVLPDRTLSGVQNVPSGTFVAPSTATLVESGNTYTIGTGMNITPSEWIALVQWRTLGSQPLILNGTGPGTGIAQGGTFDVNSGNIPGGGFGALTLPTVVQIVPYVTSLTYNGDVSMNGSVDFIAANTGTQSPTFNTSGRITGSGRLISNTTGTFTVNANNGMGTGSGSRFWITTDTLSVQSNNGASYVSLDPGRAFTPGVMGSTGAQVIDIAATGAISTPGALTNNNSFLTLSTTAGGISVPSIQLTGGGGTTLLTGGTAFTTGAINNAGGRVTIDTQGGPITVGAVVGTGGGLTLQASGAIQVASASGQGAGISLNSNNSPITTGNLVGGSISLVTTSSDISVGTLTATGNVTLQTTGLGLINTNGNNLNLDSFGNTIDINTGGGAITVGDINASGHNGGTAGIGAGGAGFAGAVINISSTGTISLGNVSAGGGGGGGGNGGGCCSGSNGGAGGAGGRLTITGGAGDVTLGTINVAGGGGGGGASIISSCCPPGNGGAAGIGGRVSISTNTGTVSIGGPILAMSGGAGGSGANGGFGLGPAGGGGSYSNTGGNGGSQGGGPGATAGGTGPLTGIGQIGSNGAASGASVGTATGGQVTLTSNDRIAVNGTIASGLFAGDSINAVGGGSFITVVAGPGLGTISTNYLPDANFQVGASTYAAVVNPGVGTGGFTQVGSARAQTVTINSIDMSPVAAAGTYGSFYVPFADNLGNTVRIYNNSMVTPSEWVAAVQTQQGAQTIIVTEPTGLGSGFASGGVITIAAANVPAGNFTNLVLPVGVTINSSVATVTYSGSADIGGVFGFQAALPTSTLAASSIGGAGRVAATRLTLNSTNSIGTPAGLLQVVTNDLTVSTTVAGSAYLRVVNPPSNMTVNNSTVQGTFLLDVSGPGPLGSISTAAGHSISASTLVLRSPAQINVTTNASFVTANAPTLVNITDTNAGLITLQAAGPIANSSASFNFNATDPASGITAVGNVAGTISMSLTSGTGGVSISGANTITTPSFQTTSTGSVIVEDVFNGMVQLMSSTVGLLNYRGAAAGGLTLAGALDSPVVDLGAGSLGITGANSINASTVTLNSTGAVNVVDTFTGTITFGTAGPSSGSTLTFDAPAGTSGIQNNSLINSPTLSLRTGNRGIISFGAGNVNATSMSLVSTGVVVVEDIAPSTITLSGGQANRFFFDALDGASGIVLSGNINAGLIYLKSGSGGISSAGFSTNATDLQLNSTGAVTFLGTAGGIVTLQASSGSSFTLALTGANSFIVGNGALNSPTVDLSSNFGMSFGIGRSINASNVRVTSPSGFVSIVDTFAGTIVIEPSSAANVNFNASDPGSGIRSSLTTPGTLSAGTVNLRSGTGGIFFPLGNELTAIDLTLNSTGPVSVYTTANGVVRVQQGSGNGFNVFATGPSARILGQGAINSPSVQFSAQGVNFTGTNSLNASLVTVTSSGVVVLDDTFNGLITLNPSSGSSITFNAGGTASGLAATGSLNSSVVSITTGTAGINLSGAGSTTASDLTVRSTGDVIVADLTGAASINLRASNSGNSNLFQIVSPTASISTSGAVTGGAVTLSALGAGRGVSLGASVTGNSSVSILSDTAINDSVASRIVTDRVTLSSASGNVILNSPYTFLTSTVLSAASGSVVSNDVVTGLDTASLTVTAGAGGAQVRLTNAQTVQVNSSGLVSVTDNRPGVISLGPSSGSSFTFRASDVAGGVNATGALNAPIAVFNAGTGGVNFTGANSVNASDLQVQSSGAATIEDTFGGMILLRDSNATSFNLNASNGVGGISGTGVLDSPTITLTSGSLGISLTGASSVNASSITANSTGGVSLLDTNNGLVTLNAGSGTSLNLNLPSGGLVIGGDFDAGSGTILLVASNYPAGNITSTGTSTLSGGAAVLQAMGTGGIGTSGQPLRTAVSFLTANAPNGRVFVQNSKATGVTIVDSLGVSNVASGDYNVNEVQGGLTIGANIGAGSFDPMYSPPPQLAPLPLNAFGINGSVMLNGAGTVDLGNGVTVTAVGDQSGNIIVTSGMFVTGGANSTFKAWGGDIVMIGATGTSLDGGSPATSLLQAVSTVSGGSKGGGGIAIMSGQSLNQTTTDLSNAKISRVFPFSLNYSSNSGNVVGNTFNLSAGALVDMRGTSNNVVGNQFDLSGGVAIFNNGGASNLTLRSVLPAIPQPPVQVDSSVIDAAGKSNKVLTFNVSVPGTGGNGNTIAPTDTIHITVIPKTHSKTLEGSISNTADLENQIGYDLFFGKAFDSAALQRLASNKILFGPSSGGRFLDLQKGMMLFAPTSDLQVQTREGTVFIPQGAIALVYETGNDVAVYDFVDFRKGVKIVSGKHQINLAPGQQVVLTCDGKADFDSINPGQDVGYRLVSKHELAAGVTAYTTDFSIISALSNYEPCQVLKKANDRTSRDTLSKMLKTAAAVHMVTGARGPYRSKTR